jgi:hypothetical protein
MKITIKELINNIGKYDLNYNNLVESYGYEILHTFDLGSWQGDLLMIVAHQGKYGLLTTGYGSCSGCDELLSCDKNITKLDELRTTLCQRVIFKSGAELVEYLDNKDWEGEYYRASLEEFHDKFKEFLKATKEDLILRHLAGL